MAGKRRYGGRRGNYSKKSTGSTAPAVEQPKAPVRSAAMQALIEESEKAQSEPEYRHDDFVPKPRAIRRYEKYAGRD